MDKNGQKRKSERKEGNGGRAKERKERRKE